MIDATKLENLKKTIKEANQDVVHRKVIVEVDVKDLKPHPDNFYSMQNIEELAEQIKVDGQLYPIEVSKESGYIISGHRRYEALKLLNKEMELKALVHYIKFDTLDAEKLHLIRANAYRTKTKEERQQEVSKLKDYYEKLKLTSDEYRNINISKLISEELGVSQRTIKRDVSEIKEPKNKKTKETKSTEILNLESHLRETLQTDVKLSGNANGNISIKYYSLDDLQRILDVLNIKID